MTTQYNQDNGGNEDLAKAGSRGGRSSGQLMRREPFEAAFEGPFSIMSRLLQDVDRMFYGLLPSSVGRLSLRPPEWRPAVDVLEQEGKLIVHADLPGMRKEDLNVEVRDNELLIAGERRSQSEHQHAGYHQTERFYGKFTRSIPLPQGIRPEDVAATFEDGVLRVEMPLPIDERAKRRHIEIH